MNNGRSGLGIADVFLIALLLLASMTTVIVYEKQHSQVDKLQTQITAQQAKPSADASNIQTDKFQAVFMKDSANGSAYFGKLSVVGSDEYKLTDIYYLKSDGTLTKLGDELHKPQDTMYIPKSSLDFWENLKDVGQFNGQLK